MSFFQTASLVFISDFAAVSASAASGSGTNTGKVYSIKPTDGSGDFVFERGSDITATRVNKDGYIEKGRGNFLLQSNNFDTTWSGATSTLSGQSGYDGSSDAWLITKPSLYNNIKQVVTNSGVQTFSVYAKAGSYNWMLLHIEDAAGDCLANFDLSTGTLGTLTNGITSKIEDVGNGWYRCSATFNRSLSDVRIYPNETEHYTGTNGSIYIQDAQLEQGLVATDYIETTTAPLRAGLLEDEPRFDYSGSTPSLLLEPSRTNLIPQSEYFGATEWVDAIQTRDITITQTLETNPEGRAICWKIQGTTSLIQLAYINSTTIGTTLTNSIYVKRVSGTGNVLLRDVNNISTSFSLSVADGWKRIDVTATATSTNARFYLNLVDYTDEILVWGAQQEEGSYPTSYIPTYGTAATRGAEGQAYSGLSSLIGQTEGTLFLDIDSAESNTEVFSLNRSTANSIFLDTNANFYRVFTWADGSTNSQPTTIANTDRIKIAIAYKSNDFAIYANGSQVSTNNTLTWTPNITIDTLNFGVGGYVNNKGVARYKQVMLIPERLSNTYLETLTTL